MVDESISEFLDTVAKHPALANNKDTIEPGHKEQCNELYIQLLEKVFDSYDKIPNSLKENVPGYDRRIFEKVKLLQIKLNQILAKRDSVSAQGSQGVIDPDNGDIYVNDGAQNSRTLTSAPRASIPSYRDPLRGRRKKRCFFQKPPSVTIEYNKQVPPFSSERISNALEIRPVTVSEDPKRPPTVRSYTRLHRPHFSRISFLNSNRPSTDSVKDNKDGELRDDYGVPINLGNDTNVTPEAAEVSNNSVFDITSSNVEEENILFDVPLDEFGWQRYREEDFEIGIRNPSKQVIGQERGENYSNKNPSSVTIVSKKEVPPSFSESTRNALEISKPMTASEAPKRDPAPQTYTQFQQPQASKISLLNNSRPSTDSVKDNKDGETRDGYGVPINMENDTNITPEAAEVNNDSVPGPSSNNVEEENLLSDVLVDEFGWQRYREEDFEMGIRNPCKQITEQKCANNYSIKKAPSGTIEYHKDVPTYTERIRNDLERLISMTATEASKRTPAAHRCTTFLNNNRPNIYSFKKSKDSKIMDDCDLSIKAGKDINVTSEEAEGSINGVSGASHNNIEEGIILFDVLLDELGWQRYRAEDFETGTSNLSEHVIIEQERNENYLFKKPASVMTELNKQLPSSTSDMIRNAPETLKSSAGRKMTIYAPVAQSSVDFQPPHFLNCNRSRTASIKGNDKEGEHNEDYNVLFDIGDGTDIMLDAVHTSAKVNDSVASTSNADIVNSALDIHVGEDGWQVYRPEDFEENVENIGIQDPQVADVMKASGDTDIHASIHNDGISGEFDGLDYPHTGQMLEIFFERFRLTAFRPNQLQVINATLLGHDCFVLMPTGGGKSLCYQLPAILMPGVTIVISPLKSLILDQVNKLLSLNISAAHLSGDLSQSTCDEIYRKLSLQEPAIKLLYVTPEKISSSNQLKSMLNELYTRGKLARFVIDEAHCVSQWGHDFRPDYKRLSVLRTQFPNTKIIALTATATPRVRTDILHQLQVRTCKWFLSSFNRPNLAYRILEKSPRSINQDIVKVIKEQFAGLSGIVYCLSRKDCEKLSADLRVAGVLAEFYHGGRSDRTRGEVQAGWTAGTYKVICATIAFGMGVDKADVRYVIHHSMPKSVEGYYQEAGRAGRDGDTAICLLYYSYCDVTRYKRMIYTDRNRTPDTVRMHMTNLRSMVELCESETECRREHVLAYLGEWYDRTYCVRNYDTACDNCLNEDTYKVDVTEDCKLIVRCIRETCSELHASFTLLHVADALCGSNYARLQALQNTPLHGRLISWTRTDVMRLLRQMLVLRFLADGVSVNDNNPDTYVAAGSNADKLLSGEQRILFAVKEQPAPAAGGGCAGDAASDGPASKRARVEPTLSNSASNPRPGTSWSGET